MTRRPAKRVKPSPEPPVAPADLLGHVFGAPELLARALTHRSLPSETNPEALADPTADNEQFEFLGDAVLGMVVADSLLRLFPASREGELTRLRASLVSRAHLGGVGARIGLGPLLRLGKGEELSGGRAKTAILADAMEAVIAAVYLDAGLEAARGFIETHIVQPSLPALKAALDPENTFSGAVGDHKSALQEHLQAAGAGQPRYVLTAQTGPDHQKHFRVEVRIARPLPDDPEHTVALAEAEGLTKKQAQQQAARLALEHLAQAGLEQIGLAEHV